VYSFGVLLLEIVSGRSCNDPGLSNDKVYLLEWVGAYQEPSKLHFSVALIYFAVPILMPSELTACYMSLVCIYER
jgi:hypothetical protein